MKNGLCPKCGTRAVYTQRNVLGVDGSGWKVGLRLPNSWLSTSPLDVYVCGMCGYLETYVADERALAKIVRTWQPIE